MLKFFQCVDLFYLVFISKTTKQYYLESTNYLVKYAIMGIILHWSHDLPFNACYLEICECLCCTIALVHFIIFRMSTPVYFESAKLMELMFNFVVSLFFSSAYIHRESWLSWKEFMFRRKFFFGIGQFFQEVFYFDFRGRYSLL